VVLHGLSTVGFGDSSAGGRELVDDRLFGGLCFTLLARLLEKMIEALALFCSGDELCDGAVLH
jgi:hypothetical protein